MRYLNSEKYVTLPFLTTTLYNKSLGSSDYEGGKLKVKIAEKLDTSMDMFYAKNIFNAVFPLSNTSSDRYRIRGGYMMFARNGSLYSYIAGISKKIGILTIKRRFLKDVLRIALTRTTLTHNLKINKTEFFPATYRLEKNESINYPSYMFHFLILSDDLGENEKQILDFFHNKRISISYEPELFSQTKFDLPNTINARKQFLKNEFKKFIETL